jgi:dipeptidase E
MKSIVLFSQLTEKNKQTILNMLFPSEVINKTFAYMPSGGIHGAENYIAEWKAIADERDTKFVVIDNASNDPRESSTLLNANTLLISGGNTFQLLSNLKKSGLDKAILEFFHKQELMLAGFSAGALVLTPTIKICNLPNFDKNLISLENLDGLNIVNFEIFPHYEKRFYEGMLNKYRETTTNHVREITDEDYIFVNL